MTRDFTTITVDPAMLQGRLVRFPAPSAGDAGMEGEDLDAEPEPNPMDVERDFFLSSVLALIDPPLAAESRGRWQDF